MTRVLGIIGWRNSGKTTLVTALLRHFRAQGLRVVTAKHTHHDVDPDPPGKDSALHRRAGAQSVLLVGPNRMIRTTEYEGAPEPDLEAVLAALRPADLVLLEGFSRFAIPRFEVWDASRGRVPRGVGDARLTGLAHSGVSPTHMPDVPLFHRDDVGAIAAHVANAAQQF